MNENRPGAGDAEVAAGNKYFQRYLIPMIIWMAVIFVSSSIPSQVFPTVEFWGWSKLVHLIYYSVLSYVVYRALSHQDRFPILHRHPYLFGLIFAVLYGATDEFHQLYTPGRHAQMTDVWIDAFGACLFIAGVYVRRWLRRRSH